MTAQQEPDFRPGADAAQPPTAETIAEDLRQEIETGELGAGEQLPGDLQLGEKYQVSRHTIHDAIELLVTDRLVLILPGEGAIVSQTVKPFITTFGIPAALPKESAGRASEIVIESRRHTVSSLTVNIHEASGYVASELQIAEGSAIVSRHQGHFIENTPWWLKASHISMRLVERGAFQLLEAAEVRPSIEDYLLSELGIQRIGERSMIAARMPDENESHFFNLPADQSVPIIEVRQTSINNNRLPFMLTVISYPADRNQLIVNASPLSPG